MVGFLIQVSGYAIEDRASPGYIAEAKGPQFCDEPLMHGEYFNASPYWKEEGFGRYDAWKTITSGDQGILYCTGSVDEHGSCLSHLLTVDEVTLDDSVGARLEFSAVRELDPKIPYGEIQQEIETGQLSEQMGYCGQEGFNITQIPETDLDHVLDLATPIDTNTKPSDAQPDESLQSIADDYFGSPEER